MASKVYREKEGWVDGQRRKVKLTFETRPSRRRDGAPLNLFSFFSLDQKIFTRSRRVVSKWFRHDRVVSL